LDALCTVRSFALGCVGDPGAVKPFRRGSDPILAAVARGFGRETNVVLLIIITAVFVDSAMQASNHTRPVLIHEEMDSRKGFLKDLRNLFHEMDQNGDGTLTATEFSQRLSDERVIAYFKALKLDVTDTVSLSQVFDSDHSDRVDVVVFLEGCYDIQGESRSIDMKSLRMQMQWMVEALEALQRQIRSQSESPKSRYWPAQLT